MDIVEKLRRLMRHHRQRVFDADGERHTRTLLRLKRTATFRRMCRENQERASHRLGELYAGMGY